MNDLKETDDADKICMEKANQTLIEAFHLMWDFFPEPVMLVAKNRTILALNRASEKDGRRQVGIKCSAMPPLERHRACKANAALSSKECQYSKWRGNFGDVVTYWLPVDGYPDCFIHFSVGQTLSYGTSVDLPTAPIKAPTFSVINIKSGK